MKVKIPREIKIAGRNYKIKFDEHLIRDEGNRGVVYWHTQEVKLLHETHPELMAVTFLHECIHIIDEHMNGRGNLTEEQVCGIADGLFQLLKDNLGIEFDWSEIK